MSCADIPCVLGGNGVGGAARSTQPVTLYITVDITPPTLYNIPPSIPTANDSSPTEEALIPGRIQPSSPEHPLPLHHQLVEAGNNKPQSREEVQSISTKNPRSALDQADQAMKRMDRSNTWQGAVGRIKWVMDAMSPIAEVRLIPFWMSFANVICTLSFSHSPRWRTVYF